MSTSLFPAAALVAILSFPGIVAGAATTVQSCANPSTVFDDKLAAEIDSFETWLTPTSPTDKKVEEVETFIANIKHELCESLTKREIESVQAVKGLHVFRRKIMSCGREGEVSASLKERFADAGVYGKLVLDSAEHFCSTLDQLQKRHEGIEVHFLKDAIKADDKLREEVFCAADKLFKLPFSTTDVIDFPPWVQFLSALESLCGQLKRGEITFEEALRQSERARIEASGGDDAFALASHIAKKKFGEVLAWPALLAGVASLVVFAVCLPLWILTSMLAWLNPTRYIWDDLQEWFGNGMGLAFLVGGLLMIIVYADSLLKFLGGVAVLATIVASVIGAIVGFKKLTGTSKSE